MTITLAVSGDQGSFSEEAGLQYLAREGKQGELLYAIDMEGVFSRITNGEAELGIFPVINTRGGLVQPAFRAMGRYTFEILDELWLEVRQCLMTFGTGEVTQIASHPQALAQCARYLERTFPGVPTLAWEDTAKAAKDLSEGRLSPTTAVIAPARSAALYGLMLKEQGIEDQRPNLTTFIVVRTPHSAV